MSTAHSIAINGIAASDIRLADRMRAANRVFLKALQTGIGPKGFPWASSPVAFQDHSYSTPREGDIEDRRVSRGVCFKCGTRTDIGCKHRRPL